MEREERLAAYVDGELAGAERDAFERELAADPALQRDLARQKALRARLSAAFDPVLDEPVPLRLTLAAQAANAPRRAWRPPQWAAMAACLALGVLVGRAALAPSAPIVERGDALMARGALARALDRQLALDGGPIRIGVTFRGADGRWCRTFESAPDKLAGLACREPAGWTARALAAWSPGPQTGFRTAASETPAAVLAAVDATLSGTPVDQAGERAARDSGWKPEQRQP
jgi:hypothetical protein